MDILDTLFDYQRFAKNAKLEARAAEVYDRYLAGGVALDDDALEFVAAAGEPYPPSIDAKTDGANDGNDG